MSQRSRKRGYDQVSVSEVEGDDLNLHSPASKRARHVGPDLVDPSEGIFRNPAANFYSHARYPDTFQPEATDGFVVDPSKGLAQFPEANSVVANQPDFYASFNRELGNLHFEAQRRRQSTQR
eukprot:TRINITY_DN8476_c0_g1_i1.p1 TRINITY_DN8476_c0_g1~~TRINITY_DN8476_c0_g1_i1.p1  ORF type:complete len:122 (+),score=12.38 TRINITY_DN8476_c0_g1_i1:128-493(+)